MYVIAHLSDTHLDGSDRNAERVARVMDYLADLAQPVDVVLVTGDIADHGLPSEYDEARKALGCPYPLLMCPGNHDERRAYRRHLLADIVDSDAPVNRVETVGGVMFAMCDSSIPGESSGYLSDETLGWLDGVLSGETLSGADDGSAFVCFHHPPVMLHSPLLDPIRLHGERRLADLLARHPRVVAVLCGHAHTAAVSTFAGRPLLVAPGVVSTLFLPWERPSRGSGSSMDDEMPPAIAFHVLSEGRLTTHYRVLP
jgi:3',5'-cyclic-AMP phosphodiesterase